jgi:hypothetical protein
MVPVTAAAFLSAVACPTTGPLAGGGAYYPLNEGSGVTSRAVVAGPTLVSSSSPAPFAAAAASAAAAADMRLAAASLWTNATYAQPVATIRVDGDLSTEAGARRCFSAAAASACGAVMTAARGFVVSFGTAGSGVEVDVSELGDGTAVVCYRPVSACGAFNATVSLPGLGLDGATVSVTVSIDSKPGEVICARSPPGTLIKPLDP